MNTDLTPDELAARYQLLCRSTQVEAAKDPQAQQIEGHLQALDKLLKHDLRALARRGSPDDFADIYFALEQELERFHEFCSFPALAQKFVVAFGGGFSAGKSSLINTLLGKRLLVTEVDPTTSLPTYLLKGEHDAVHAHNLFGHRIDLSTEEFLSLTHDEIDRYGSNVSRLLRSAFITRANFPWNNLALIDTPGYTKHEDQTQGARTDEHVARTQLNAAQAIVWVIDARKGCITEDDLRFLASVQADIPRLIVVSRADQKPAEDISAIMEGIKATLSERNLPFVDVISVSARKRQEWPVERLFTQLAVWSQQPRTLRFTHNFKAQFTHYASFIEEEQRQAQSNLNLLNRILVMAESQEVQVDAKKLKTQAEQAITVVKQRAAELLDLRHRFFSELKSIGDTLDIILTEPQDKIIDKYRIISLQEYIQKTEANIWHKIPAKIKENWESQLNGMRNYIPKIGVFGKTGAGKSSLCNALFGQDICDIGDFQACTKEPKEITLSLGTGGLTLIDVPGVGESSEDDKKYHALYRNLLQEIDLLLWVVNGNNRGSPLDEPFKNIIHHYIDAGKPFLAVINHVDHLEPFREWDEKERKPGEKQTANIEEKRIRISELFKIPINKVVAISAYQQYGLTELVDSIVHELPNEQKFVVLKKIKAADDAKILAV